MGKTVIRVVKCHEENSLTSGTILLIEEVIISSVKLQYRHTLFFGASQILWFFLFVFFCVCVCSFVVVVVVLHIKGLWQPCVGQVH